MRVRRDGQAKEIYLIAMAKHEATLVYLQHKGIKLIIGIVRRYGQATLQTYLIAMAQHGATLIH